MTLYLSRGVAANADGSAKTEEDVLIRYSRPLKSASELQSVAIMMDLRSVSHLFEPAMHSIIHRRTYIDAKASKFTCSPAIHHHMRTRAIMMIT